MEKWFEGTLARRILSLALSIVMVLTLLPMPSIAAEGDGLCEHHTEHTGCGYVEAVAGHECGHVCGEECYTVTTDCQHVHDESCYSDGVLPATGEEKEPDKCTHACTEESGCVTKAHTCVHTDHDDSCGYVEAVAGQPCGFICWECAANARIQAFLDAVAALDPDSPDADALLDAACEALDALEDEDRELPEVQEAITALDEALGIIPEEAALYIDIPEIPTAPQVYPDATQIRLKAVGFPSITGTKVQQGQKLLGYTVTSASNTEIILTVSYMGNSSGTITLPKASDLWVYDTPNELLRIVWKNSGKQEGDQVSFAYGLNIAQYDFKGTPVTYMLVYDLDGGEGNIPPASQTTDEQACKFDVTTQKPTRAGYNFLGWAETRGATTPSTQTSYTVKRKEGTTKTLYAVWKRLVTVTYTDGVDGETLFADQKHTVESGSNTPVFQGTPTRSGYVFDCWKSSDYLGGWIDWQNKVYNDVTYVAFWKADKNNNGKPDENEPRYTVTYEDGLNGAIFRPETHSDILSGLKTPAFTKKETISRPGYVLYGWSPSWSSTVTKNVTYTAIWKEDKNNNGKPDENEPRYTVTYEDGLNGAIFQPETHSGILSGLSTPAFTKKETVSRPEYVLYGWENWKSTVSGNVTYTAIWEPDINNNGKADKDETKYTVTYKDGVSGAAFPQQQYTNQLIKMPTPPFTGKMERQGYVFDGWNPEVQETISGNATYTAKWEPDVNGNGVADRDDPKYTILYTDGVKNAEVFRDQVTLNCLPGITTPAFNGTPTRKGYVFGGWSPEMEATVTDTTIYTAVWKLDANENGTADEEEIIILSLPDKTYDGQPVSMDGKYKVLDGGAVTVTYKPKDAADTAYTADAPKNAGTYTVRLTKTLGDDSVSVTKEFTIQPKAVTVSGITAEDKTYDGNTTVTLNFDHVVFDGKLDGDTLKVTATGACVSADAGEEKTVNISGLTLDGTSKDNYTLSSTTTTTTATINPKSLSDSDITVTVSDLTYTGSQQSPTVTVMYGTIALVKDTDYTLSGNTATNVGTYTLTVTGTDNYTAFTTKDWKIDKASITPVVSLANTVYGKTLNPSVSGNPGNGEVTYTYYSDEACTTEVTPKDVGTYYVKAAVAATDNYQSGTSNAVSFRITKKALTVTANDKTITYGEAPANGGVTYDGFVSGEKEDVLGGTLDYTYTYSQYGNVGDSYTITPSGLTSGNYDITFAPGTLTVNQKEIGIDWSNTSLAYNKAEQAPTATATGLVNNDKCTITVTGQKTDVGNYTATASSLSNGNYKLPENRTYDFSITKVAPAFTKPTGKTPVYTGTALELAEAGTTEDGTMQYRLGEDGEWSTAIPTATAIGTYTVYYYVEGDGNHTDSDVQFDTAEILPFTINQEPQDTTVNYGENTTLTFEAATKLEGDVTYQWYLVTIVDGKTVYTPLENETGSSLTLTKPNAGTYTYACEVTCGDYKETSAEAVVTVTAVKEILPPTTDLPSGLWVEGGEEPLNGNSIDLKSPSSGFLTQYTEGTNTQGDPYPTGMAVYRIVQSDDGAAVEEITELNDLLQYAGCSIRITGKRGIRMITSLTRESKAALTNAGLAGYTLEEYGTVIQWADTLAQTGASLTLDTGNHNYAYKKGVSDPVFANVGDLTQYTNVLVWENLTDAQLGQDIVMRPYIKLSKDGQTVTLYGGCVSRSIGYIAYQNRAVFKPGTAAYKYVWDIIHAVYGDQYDSEYQG